MEDARGGQGAGSGAPGACGQSDASIPPYGKAAMPVLQEHVEHQSVMEGRALLLFKEADDRFETPVVFEFRGHVSAIKKIAVESEFDGAGLADHARVAAARWMRENSLGNAGACVDEVIVHVKLERSLETMILAATNRASARAMEKAKAAFQAVNGSVDGSGKCSCGVKMERLASGGIQATATATCVVEGGGHSVEAQAEEHVYVPSVSR